MPHRFIYSKTSPFSKQQFMSILFLMSTSPSFSPDEFKFNLHYFMLMLRKSLAISAFENIFKHSVIQLLVTIPQVFLQSIYAKGSLLCLLLQSLSTVLSINNCVFFCNSLYNTLFTLMATRVLFPNNYTSCLQSSHSSTSTSRISRIWNYSYQLRCSLQFLFGIALQLQKSCSLAKDLLHSKYH